MYSAVIKWSTLFSGIAIYFELSPKWYGNIGMKLTMGTSIYAMPMAFAYVLRVSISRFTIIWLPGIHDVMMTEVHND